MAEDIRYRYVQKWAKEAREKEDPYERFISFWMAMTIAAQISRPKHKLHHEEDTNREKIFDYFLKNKKAIFEVVERNSEVMIKLTRMQGPRHKDPIIDTGDPELRNRFSELVRYYSGKIRKFSQRRMAENMAELVSRTRYSLFRAGEAGDMDYDRALLELLNPIIADVLKTCEGV